MSSNLPPGCTDGDIERNAGAYKMECQKCGTMEFDACELSEEGHCPRCENSKEPND